MQTEERLRESRKEFRRREKEWDHKKDEIFDNVRRRPLLMQGPLKQLLPDEIAAYAKEIEGEESDDDESEEASEEGSEDQEEEQNENYQEIPEEVQAENQEDNQESLEKKETQGEGKESSGEFHDAEEKDDPDYQDLGDLLGNEKYEAPSNDDEEMYQVQNRKYSF